MRRFLASAAIAAALLAPAAADAAVTYTFTGSTENYKATFTLTVANFITDGEFAPASCVIDNPNYTCGGTMTFDADPNFSGTGGDYIGFNDLFDDGASTGSGTAFFFFQPGAFAAVGTYSNAGWPENGPPIGPDDSPYGCCYGNAGVASLTVSGSPDGAVPEPATWALLITGFGGAGAMLRRRRARDTFVAA